MQSRMDRYCKEDDNAPKRSEKNSQLYRELNHSSYNDYDSFPIPENSNIIDLNKLKKNLDSRSEYKQAQKINIITKTSNEPIESKPIPKKEETIYDINELIERARHEKEKLQAVQKKILDTNYNFLNSLESNSPIEEDVIETTRSDLHKTDKVELKPMEEEALLKTTTNLSLDILADLKPNESEKKVLSTKISPPKEPISVQDFYSTSYTFTKKDFDDDNDDKVKKPIALKIFLILLLIAVICATTYFILKYFDIKIIT